MAINEPSDKGGSEQQVDMKKARRSAKELLEGCANREDWMELYEYLLEIDQELRTILMLQYVFDQPRDRIAYFINCSEEAVEGQIKTAFEALAQVVGKRQLRAKR